jgi:ribose transport system permease protein
MTMIIVAGGIDLSVGAILAFSSMLGAMVMQQGGPIWLGILVGIASGCLCGLINGLLSTQLKINPFIVTLGTMGIFRGAVLSISGGLPVHTLPKGFAFLSEGSLLGIPTVLYILFVSAAAVHVLLEHTRLGRYAFAIGSNAEAAFYAGIPVSFHTTAVYACGGLLTGLAGMIESSRLMTGQPTAGQGYELHGPAGQWQRSAGHLALLATGHHRRRHHRRCCAG